LKTKVKLSHGPKLKNGLLPSQTEDFLLPQKYKVLLLRIVANQNMKIQPSEQNLSHSQETFMVVYHLDATKVFLAKKQRITEVAKLRLNLERLALIGEVIIHINTYIIWKIPNLMLVLKQVIINVETQTIQVQFGVIQLIQEQDGSFVIQLQPLDLGLQQLILMEEKVIFPLDHFTALLLPGIQ